MLQVDVSRQPLAHRPLSADRRDHAAVAAKKVTGIQEATKRARGAWLVCAAFDATHHFSRSARAFKWRAIFLAAVAQTVAADLGCFVFVV